MGAKIGNRLHGGMWNEILVHGNYGAYSHVSVEGLQLSLSDEVGRIRRDELETNEDMKNFVNECRTAASASAATATAG